MSIQQFRKFIDAMKYHLFEQYMDGDFDYDTYIQKCEEFESSEMLFGFMDEPKA